MNSRAKENLELLKKPQIAAFLYMIAESEGADYGTLVFGKRKNSEIKDFSAHPAARGFIRSATINGKKVASTAAGRYQFIKNTWNRLAAKLDLTDFSPQSQDIAAIELLREVGADASILQNDFAGAVSKTRKIWASLPAAGYGQNENSFAKIKGYFEKGLQLAGSGLLTAATPINLSVLIAGGVVFFCF